MTISFQSELVKQAVSEFKETPSLTLAKKLYKENSGLFISVEHVRRLVRYYRGADGKTSRKQTDRNYPQLADESPRPYNPFQIPEAEQDKPITWKLPHAYRRVLIMSDIHFPYHDVEAIEAAVLYAKERGVEAVFINGDLLDIYQASFHERDPRKMNIAEELEMGRKFFQWLKEELNLPIYYIPGNHEARIERYLKVKAPELLGIPEFKLEFLLRCAEYGVTYIPFRSKCYIGKLLVEHGDKIPGAGGVNPARTALLKFKRPVIVGHFHRTTQENSSVYDGDQQMAWSTGCLCTLEPDYMPLNNHNHGAAIIDVEHSTGHYRVENFVIINGKVY